MTRFPALAEVTSPDALARRGAEMHALMAELMPLPRSLTGDGVRATFRALSRRVPVQVTEVPTGTRLYDWTVPDEWTLRGAWVTGPDGRRVVDARDRPIHVVGYSEPVHARMPLADLRPHLHTLPDRPGLVPFRTAYWDRGWGFCLAEEVARALPDGEYEVVIDATLAPGSLSYAEHPIPGSEGGEVLLSTPSCHPDLANDNLSAVVVLWALADVLGGLGSLRNSYRFLWAPATLGPLAWLSRNEDRLDRVVAGLSVMCVGDAGGFTWKRSRAGDALVDRAVAAALAGRVALRDFVPWGGDERQFCSPGFDLPVGMFSRTPPGEYPENHTSADDLELVRPEHLAGSLAALLAVVEALETDGVRRNRSPYGEPQLGRRGLTRRLGGEKVGHGELAMYWVLNMSDGTRSLLDIALRSGLPYSDVRAAADALTDAGLLSAGAEGVDAA